MTKRGVTQFLRWSESSARKFYEMTPDIEITLDALGNIIEVNPAFEKQLNRAAHEVFGTPIVNLVHEMDMAKFLRGCSLVEGRPPFRLLKKFSGCIMVDLINIQFARILSESERRGYLILRPLGMADE